MRSFLSSAAILAAVAIGAPAVSAAVADAEPVAERVTEIKVELPSKGGAAAGDNDERCAEWAANGECECEYEYRSISINAKPDME